MPALKLPDTERLTLSNGLNVVLCHAPRLKRAAASVRVAAGSHDVSGRWPGLAHFLEHLFFLGTERFGADQNLMRFVQRHGGQINASTRERTTDFFFELPTAAFADGVERLCDMLAHPRMDPAEQLREREVLHAEFIAWSRDAEARDQTARLAAINPQHPLRGFHAGNRYSLKVPDPAFQQALKNFYARFYQAGQITLCLSGPQSLDELRSLAMKHGALFREGTKVAQVAPPPLVDAASRTAEPPVKSSRLHLSFVCEGLPDAADKAVAFLCHWLSTPKPGGVVARLLDNNLIDSLKTRPVYQFDGQLLLEIEFQNVDPERRNAVTRLLFSWLGFFKTHWPALVAEFDAVQQRRLQTCNELELAHHYCRDLPGALGEHGGAALEALIAQLTPDCLLTRQAVQGNNDALDAWRLPPANPFLQATETTSALLAPNATTPVVFHQPLATQNDQAAVFLRWQLRSAQPRLWRMLNERLQAIREDARQAGVSLSFSAYGVFWELKLTGVIQPMAAIIEHALRQIIQADANSLARYRAADNEPPLIPIRQLLKVLPDRYLATRFTAQAADPYAVWAEARCLAFATGFATLDESSISAALSLAPGTPQAEPAPLMQLQPGKHWLHEATEASEDAVLVFCPTASSSIAEEAAWRLLGHLLQGPFYQRLRVELQLGYAVFSGLRQIGGRTGLLFGVQSPACSAAELVRHTETFIDGLPDLVEAADLDAQKLALSAQFNPAGLPNEQLAELLWQAHLAGHADEYFEHLQTALAALDRVKLVDAARRLPHAEAGWLVLANRSAPANGQDRYLNGNGLS